MSAAPIGIVTIEDIFEAMLQEDIEDETDVALRDSRMSAASSLREMSMSLTSRPSAMGNNPILAYSAGTQSVASTAGFSVGAGTGTGAGAGAGELAMTDRNSGAGEGFGVARTSSSVGQASTPQPSTTFPKAIRPTVLQPAAAISVPTGQRDRANDGAAAKPELSQPQTASYSPTIQAPLISPPSSTTRYTQAQAQAQGKAQPAATNPMLSQLKPSTYNKFNHRMPPRRSPRGGHGSQDEEASRSMDFRGLTGGHAAGNDLEDGQHMSRASSLDSFAHAAVSAVNGPSNVNANSGLLTTQTLLRTKGLTGSMLARHLGVVKNKKQERTSSVSADR
jgi:hypothetical protein